MKVAIGSDHAGYQGKEAIKLALEEMRVEYQDLGTHGEDSADYPDYAARVGAAVSRGEVDRGILVCGSGIGMEIAANKVAGVHAALAWNEETARLSRQHNDANVVAVGARTTPPETIRDIVRAFLNTECDRVFGVDYNRDLMRWITEHYRLAARFDSDYSRDKQFGDKPFFILAYERPE